MKFSVSILAAGIFMLGTIVLLNTTTFAQDDDQLSGYTDLLDTKIRGLSAEQIEGYQTGSGLGMALPAELNGYPGPRHVLDFDSSDELKLTDSQNDEIQALYDEMLPEAIRLGEEILTQEAELEQAFRNGTIDNEFLKKQLTSLSELYADLRFAHLSTHLATINVLTPHQVVLYNSLRGYADSDMDHSGH
jgi:Spy/CpxP family protein refolding chaperone